MQKLLLVALALVAIAFAQQLQSPPIAPQTLVSGVTVSKTLQPVAEDRALWTDSYRIWVPENAALVNVTIANTGDDCSYLEFVARTSAYPCNPQLYAGDLDGDEAVCEDVEEHDVYYGDSDLYQYVPGYQNGLFEFKAGGWWYFGVGRYYDSDNDTACPYSIAVSIAQNCSVGSVGVSDSSSDYTPSCVAYTAINSSNINQQQTLTGVTAAYTVYKVQVPSTTAEYLNVVVNSTSSDLYLYGRSYSVAYYSSSSYDCYTGSYTTSGSFYIYTLECPAPRSGAFFILIENDDSSSWNANVNFVLNTCNNPNLLGEGCQYGSQAFPLFLDGVPIPLDQVQEWTYAYVDFGDYGSNYTSARVTVTYRQGNVGTADLYTRLNAFPTAEAYESSGQYQDVTSSGAGWLFTPFDLAEAGRLYIGLNCDSICNYTVTVLATGLSATTNNGETTTTTTSTSTTASTTTTGTSTGTSSSASTSTSTSEAALSTVSYFVAVCAVVATLLLSY